MGTWRVGYQHSSRCLIYDAEGPLAVTIQSFDPPRQAVEIPENDVAKLLLFLQGCQESWKLTPGEDLCTASHSA